MLENAFPDLPSNAWDSRLLFLTYPPDGSGRVAVVSQEGRIYVLANERRTIRAFTFLDISSKVSREGNEEGLLGLAFHPAYAKNGQFYVYYSALSPRRSVLSRFQVSQDANAADQGSEQILLEVPQPFPNHNGGMLAFGPDGYLYVGLGDGGGAGDPSGNGQSLTTLLGKILRIDVDRGEGERAYAVPPDNPFTGADSPPGSRSEIWAYGLRNPWRFSFDRETGDLWAADVGQNRSEEIDLIRRGGNYGWNMLEGDLCFRPSSGCDRTRLEPPVLAYGRDLGCSVTGGYVYRGAASHALRGVYVYADFCSGRLWGLRYDSQAITVQRELARTGLQIASFGEDEAGELYILAFDGGVYRVRQEAG
ncbi:MAG: PQQ-dependent sugar dehydrogenase [Chloroflexi bacterium]|nr:PQQ-dependent sugar dehydrogenase [Chloroflexota bacterium]